MANLRLTAQIETPVKLKVKLKIDTGELDNLSLLNNLSVESKLSETDIPELTIQLVNSSPGSAPGASCQIQPFWEKIWSWFRPPRNTT